MAKSPKKLKKGVLRIMRSMVGKAMELGWSPYLTDKECKAAIDAPKFVYCRVTEMWGPWKRGKNGNDGGFLVSWGAEKVGFGELSICMKKGNLCVDTEAMGPEFARRALWYLFKNGAVFDPKEK